MDWSKTKTIFIIVFLVLDVFLFYQYYHKITSYDYEMLAESTIADKLKENNIKHKPFPKQTSEEQFLSAKSKIFQKEEFKKLKNQKVEIIDGQKIKGKFTKPFLLGEKNYTEAIDTFVNDNIIEGKNYKYWNKEENADSIVYYQVYKDKMIYQNNHAKLELFINKNREITHYEQTYLENIEPFNEKEQVYSAVKAVEVLFENGYIPDNSEITNVELGYTNLILLTASHVLTPTWHFEIDDKEHLYVNALRGQVIQPEEIVEDPDDPGFENFPSDDSDIGDEQSSEDNKLE